MSFLLKYVSAMPLGTQSDLRLLLGVVLTIHLFLPNTLSKYTPARQRVGGNDAACVWDCPTWESVGHPPVQSQLCCWHIRAFLLL